MWEPNPYDQDPFQPGESGPPEPLWALRMPGDAEPEPPAVLAAAEPVLTAPATQPLLAVENAAVGRDGFESAVEAGVPGVPASGLPTSSLPAGKPAVLGLPGLGLSGLEGPTLAKPTPPSPSLASPAAPGVPAPKIEVQSPRTVLRRLSELPVAPAKSARPEVPAEVSRMEQVLAGLEQQISAPRTPLQPSPSMPNLMERIRTARLRAEQMRGQAASVDPAPAMSAPVVSVPVVEQAVVVTPHLGAERVVVEPVADPVVREQIVVEQVVADQVLEDVVAPSADAPVESFQASSVSVESELEPPASRQLPAWMDEVASIQTGSIGVKVLEAQALETASHETSSLEAVALESVALESVALESVALDTVALETDVLEGEALEAVALETESIETEPSGLVPVEADAALQAATEEVTGSEGDLLPSALDLPLPEFIQEPDPRTEGSTASILAMELAASDFAGPELSDSNLLDVPPMPAFALEAFGREEEPSVSDEPAFPLFLSAGKADSAPAAMAAPEIPIPDDLVPPLPPVLSPGGRAAMPPIPPPQPGGESSAPAAPSPESKAAKRHLESLVGALDLEMNEGLSALSEQVGPSRGPQSRGSLGLSPTARDRSADANAERFVVFFMNGSRYGLPIGEVVEMANVPRTTPLPNAPEFIRGVANLRGEVLAVIDLRVLLSLEAATDTLRERMIVVRSTQSDAVAGLIVDSVRGLARLGLSEIVQPSSPVEDRVADFLQGVASHEEQVLNVLDTRKLFSAPEMLSLAAV